MATKDITDMQVVQAFAEMAQRRGAGRGSGQGFEYADVILQRMTNQPPKVCERAMERACGRGLVEYGMWLRGGWLTEKGKALIASAAATSGFQRPEQALKTG